VTTVSDDRETQERYAQYPSTLLAFEGGPTLDLRRALTARERDLVRRLGLGPTFAVLTAENPDGDEPEGLSPDARDERERENVRRVLRLEEALTLAGVRFRRVTSRSPDGRHRERCVAVALPRERAAALARDRDQLALFWYDGERFWLWPGEVDAAPEPLPAP
jgi:uncharacterized protein DUF3293